MKFHLLNSAQLARVAFGLVLFSAPLCFGISVLFAQDDEALRPTRVEAGAPNWLESYDFDTERFTFVRLRYSEPSGHWATDYPDADINISRRVRELTQLEVEPRDLVLDISDPRLEEYPFAYLSADGRWKLSDEEAAALRQYLSGGGFLLIDDSWGETDWGNTREQMGKIFPGEELKEVSLQHEIFHSVYDLQTLPQVWSINSALSRRGDGAARNQPEFRVSYRGVTDADGRLIVLIGHNTDLADGWERVSESEWYAREFSEKLAFPMGINVIFYALTSAN